MLSALPQGATPNPIGTRLGWKQERATLLPSGPLYIKVFTKRITCFFLDDLKCSSKAYLFFKILKQLICNIESMNT